MIHHMIMTADEAIEKLKCGQHAVFADEQFNSGNVSAALRKFTYEYGQHPHAIIVTCFGFQSDSGDDFFGRSG